jgi:hypothetical protein
MENNVVILGVTPTTAFIFDVEFPKLQKVQIVPYGIQYSVTLPLAVKLLLDAPRIAGVIKKEKEQLAQLINEYGIDVVISDNRFGLCSEKVECIYITHQLHIQAGLFSTFANSIHHHYIRQFNEVWVPDFEEEKISLAGKLSHHSAFKNVKYIGPLSRLDLIDKSASGFDYVCILSGPEPLRTKLETTLIHKANGSDKQICIVRGTNKELLHRTRENVHIINAPSARELSSLMTNAHTIICRSGYSTLMDLYHLQKQNCILIPTPGQHEQEYLAKLWGEKPGFKAISEKEISSIEMR